MEMQLLIIDRVSRNVADLGADKVLDVPMFSQGGDDAFLDGPPAGAADGDTHLVMAPG